MAISSRRKRRPQDGDVPREEIPAEHVRDALYQGADDEGDILPYAREHDLIVVTSDVTDFADLGADAHAGIVLLYDDMMAAYRIASGLLAMVDAYSDRDVFGAYEELDAWIEE